MKYIYNFITHQTLQLMLILGSINLLAEHIGWQPMESNAGSRCEEDSSEWQQVWIHEGHLVLLLVTQEPGGYSTGKCFQ